MQVCQSNKHRFEENTYHRKGLQYKREENLTFSALWVGGGGYPPIILELCDYIPGGILMVNRTKSAKFMLSIIYICKIGTQKAGWYTSSVESS